MEDHMQDDTVLTAEADELAERCFAPLIAAYKKDRSAGGDFAESFRELSPGQQALFTFRVFYAHAVHSREDLYWWSAYFLAKGREWNGIKDGLRFFGDLPMLQLLERLEGVLAETGHALDYAQFDLSFGSLALRPELLAAVEPIDAEFRRLLPSTLQRIGRYIREHPQEFERLPRQTDG
ncbi:hypothetical protein [Paenibacillus mucilaginosus]|nr:hypothetical protein [Paenibacillus mucilaginosus]AEI43816.1 hypothetical protein KNP414_05292 [Paenibacillus mucilaginosus KNP414]MCG7212667.1 hypothetical protein [Paenibacillus mucilaginosus]WDM25314.1 hypothetical protein KCX80_22970 [Paenibacillus mucilaginosus]WFA19974.1 hypothetical protein ERY13_23420 [Paenibacillus mucilaginosus]